MRRAGIAIGLTVVLGVLILGGWFASRSAVHATPVGFEITGPLSQDPDGARVASDDFNTYPLVSGIDLSPFIGSTPTLDGGLDEGTLYVTALTLGGIHVTVDEYGTPIIDTTGTVESVGEDYVTTVEGITFTLTDSDELPQAVGQSAEIQGDLTGDYISVTSLIL